MMGKMCSFTYMEVVKTDIIGREFVYSAEKGLSKREKIPPVRLFIPEG